jgi:hypothetical protein
LGAAGAKREKVSFYRGARANPVVAAWRSARHSAPQSKNKSARIARKRRAGRQEQTGEELNLISYLPAAVTTLFVLAASLLLGYLQ